MQLKKKKKPSYALFIETKLYYTTALCNRFSFFALKLELPLILECKVMKPRCCS